MGLFSSKTKVYVASSVYNMAGDPDLRPNFLRSVIISGIMDGGSKGMSDHIRSGMLNGPAARRRSFFRWARDNYVYGMPAATLNVDVPVSAQEAYAGLLPLLSLGPNQSIRISSAIVDDGDINYWAERWVAEHYPMAGEDDWTADLDQATQEITISVLDFEVGRIPVPEHLTWASEAPGRKLLYIAYEVITQRNQKPRKLEATVSPPQLFTYRMGSGNVVFDNILRTRTEVPEFFPIIPVRLGKDSIRDDRFAETYPGVKKGYQKLSGGKIEELLDQVEENEDIDKVDSAYIVQAVSFSTEDNIGREYIYRFLRKLKDWEGLASDQEALRYEKAVPDREEVAETLAWNRWVQTHKDYFTTSPTFGESSPFTQLFGGLSPLNTYGSRFTLQIRSEDLSRADFRICWRSMSETHHVGNAKTFDGDTSRGLAKVGDYWFKRAPAYKLQLAYRGGGEGNEGRLLYRTVEIPQVYLFHQYAKRRYSKLTIVGLVHRNFIYKFYSADNTSGNALDDLADGDDSPFLVPIHLPTLNEMGMAKANQLSTCSSYLVFNSYKKVKIKWYQRGIFKVVMVVAAIALAAWSGGASLAGGAGILGTNVGVGLALGASAVSAAIVGAIANYVAAVIVTALIQKASVKLFGEKIGSIIAAVAGFVAITYGTQFAVHGNFAVDWGQLIKVDNLLKITDSVNGAYTRWLNMDTAEIQAEMEAAADQYEEQMERIQELTKETLGMTSGEIDPMMLLDASEHFGESSDIFLSRTLLTGSDIAELTFAMVENFADISLELPGSSSRTA